MSCSPAGEGPTGLGGGPIHEDGFPVLGTGLGGVPQLPRGNRTLQAAVPGG